MLAACTTTLPRVARPAGPQPAWLHSFISRRTPHAFPRFAGGLPGRPFCRIYFDKRVWILELEPASGAWLEPARECHRMGDTGGPSRLTFPTLSAAIGYAERHGLDYRVVPPPSHVSGALARRGQMEPTGPRMEN
jgi:hypothetical protein